MTAPVARPASPGLPEAAEGLSGLVERLVGEGRAEPDETTVRSAMSVLAAAVRLYGDLAQKDPRRMLAAELDANVTDAATVAAALLHHQELSVFEFNLWYARVTQFASGEPAREKER